MADEYDDSDLPRWLALGDLGLIAAWSTGELAVESTIDLRNWEIFHAWKTRGVRVSVLARRYGLSMNRVGQICRKYEYHLPRLARRTMMAIAMYHVEVEHG